MSNDCGLHGAGSSGGGGDGDGLKGLKTEPNIHSFPILKELVYPGTEDTRRKQTPEITFYGD